MGEVYRARDTRLGREVAIKVLPAERLHDETRRRRFIQEAQSASALNHPNIVTIHEIESADDIDFIVMEYVKGASLDTLIPRQGMPLAELLRIAIPVADALAAAHGRGIIHRDLKPANVMIGDGRTVKVLDFGLAKLVSDNDSGSGDRATVTQIVAPDLSTPGAILGTAAYMAPEQASGGKVDARSDIFSFGTMLYEMATGTRAFSGSSMADTLAAVMRAQPTPPTAVVASLPRELERLILRCLRKEPERRYQTILDVKNELQEIKEESDSGRSGVVPAPPPRPWRRIAVGAAGLAVIAVAAVAWSFLRPRGAPNLPPMRVVPLTTLAGSELAPSLSPDGEFVAFAWADEKADDQARRGFEHFDIYVKQVGTSEVRRLTTTPGFMFPGGWSPDGRQIAYERDERGKGEIHLISPVSGADRKLIDFPLTSAPRWTPDGQSLIAAGLTEAPYEGGVYLIPIGGGKPRLIMPQPKGVNFICNTTLAPDGHHVAYLACSGHSGCALAAVDFDDQWRLLGSPQTLAQGLDAQTGVEWDGNSASVLYVDMPAPETFYMWRKWLAGDRPPERVELAGLGARMPSLSVARHRLAFARCLNSIGVFTLESTPRPVLVNTFWDVQPQFSPDGTQLVFSSSRSGEGLEVWLAAADGSNPRQLTHGPGRLQASPSWSPDGRHIAFDSRAQDGALRGYVIAIDGGEPAPISSEPGNQATPTWSRDGRWIYYLRDYENQKNVWRVPSAGGVSERMTDTGASVFAAESLDGTELVYKTDFEDSPLLARPLSGGQPRQLVACVSHANYFLGAAGIYYAACGNGPRRTMHLLDRTGRDKQLGDVDEPWAFSYGRPAVSPDGKTILVQKQTLSNDLMLIENFQ
jgi:Tol biopolymer transport system component